MERNKSRTGKEIILRRVRWLYVIFLVVAAAIVGRVVWIQYGPHGDELRQLAEEVTFRRVMIPAERGDILSRDGRVLATTVPEYEIRMDFGIVPDTFPRVADTLAGSLAALFRDRDKASYRTMLLENFADRKRYVRIGDRKVGYNEEKVIAQFPWFSAGRYRSGYIAEMTPRRFMPMSPLARSVLGTIRDDSVASGGVEMSYDSLLRGTPGWTMKQKISGSFWIPVPDDANSDPVNGMDIVTTIDADIQDVAADMLRRQVGEYDAYWGTVMVMDVPTGEIVAMANLGRLDDGGYGEIYNYGIRRRVEPGSTFKLASLLTLLKEGGMTLGDMVDCTPDAGNGLTARVGAANVRDDHRSGVLTLRGAFEQSSNIGFARSVFARFGGDAGRFVDFVRDSLHLSGTTGIDLPLERASDIKHPVRQKERWDATALQMMSYGYALEVTPLQVLTLYNAVANDGLMMRPRVVRQVRNYGEVVRHMVPDTVAMIASPATIAAAQQALAGVVEEGTGRIVMKGASYSAVAKTGTAQQVREGSGGYRWPDGSLDILATFVGYFPIENPKYSCIVAIKLHEPRGKRYYGSNVAGPVFRAVADRLYARSVELHDKRYTGPETFPAEVKRTYREPVADTLPNDSLIMGGRMPSVIGMGLCDAIYVLEQAGLPVSFGGTGGVVAQRADSTGVVLTLR